MDGNRRWAKNRFLPAALGHAAGARRVREVVQAGFTRTTANPVDVTPPADVQNLRRGDTGP